MSSVQDGSSETLLENLGKCPLIIQSPGAWRGSKTCLSMEMGILLEPGLWPQNKTT